MAQQEAASMIGSQASHYPGAAGRRANYPRAKAAARSCRALFRRRAPTSEAISAKRQKISKKAAYERWRKRSRIAELTLGDLSVS
jgi:hypothetical protein